MAKRNIQLRKKCDFEMTMDVISGKWKGLIIYHLFKGTQRFSELKECMPEITQRVLTMQLRELEEAQLINRKVYATVPPKVEYSLTPLGQTLKPAFDAINEWGKFYKTQHETIV